MQQCRWMANLGLAVGLDVCLSNSIHVFLPCSASGYFLPKYVCHTKDECRAPERKKERKITKKERSSDSRKGARNTVFRLRGM